MQNNINYSDLRKKTGQGMTPYPMNYIAKYNKG